jgi:ankyrin repeat protein
LHHTAVGGQAELARLLLRAGALVDAQDDAGVTPLIRVAVHADVAPSGPLGMMAQAMAYAQGVIENGPAGLSERVHPLHDKHLATAAVLLEAKADPDHMAGNGYSALHQAAENGAVPLVQVLLAAGATAGLRNGKGYTPMHAACDRSHAEVVRILLEAGADPDAADDYGFVALHGAAVQGSVETARVLLAAGADRSPRTRDGYDKITAGMTPADAATAYGYDELAALLR